MGRREWFTSQFNQEAWRSRLSYTKWATMLVDESARSLVNIATGSEVLVVQPAGATTKVLVWIRKSERVEDLTDDITTTADVWADVDLDPSWWQTHVREYLNGD